MRTTVTLDPDVEELIRAAMQEQRSSFKKTLNDAVRTALLERSSVPFRQRSFEMGFRPEISYDKALQIASGIEGQEIVHDMAVGR